MRQIERQMLKAIEEKRNWQLNNTLVSYEDVNSTYGPRSEVYLFGNHIGDYWYQSGKFEANVYTLLDWPSVTTISRLRALGVNVYKRKGIVYLEDKPISTYFKEVV